MATPMHDKDYEKRKQEAQELIAAGGCSAIKLWSGTDAERLCPKDHIKDVKFDPLEAPVYITEWLDAAKKAVELINRGIFLLQPVSSEPAKESHAVNHAIEFTEWINSEGWSISTAALDGHPVWTRTSEDQTHLEGFVLSDLYQSFLKHKKIADQWKISI